MEILDYIDIAATDPEHVAQAVVDYIKLREGMMDSLDVKIRVSICKTPSATRAGKNDRAATLAQLVAITGIGVWENSKFKFDFAKGLYIEHRARNQDVVMHLTAGEAVALYQKLVRKNDSPSWAAFYSNLKRKHGADFLEGEL